MQSAGPGVEQLREALHPNTPSRCWGLLLTAVLRVPAYGQEAQAPDCQFASFPTNKISLKLIFCFVLFCLQELIPRSLSSNWH